VAAVDSAGALQSTAQPEQKKDGLIDPLYIFDIEMPDAISKLIFWH
jgi:hypothetical protein